MKIAETAIAVIVSSWVAFAESCAQALSLSTEVPVVVLTPPPNRNASVFLPCWHSPLAEFESPGSRSGSLS